MTAGFFQTKTLADCDRWMIEDATRRADMIRKAIEVGQVPPHKVAWAKATEQSHRDYAAQIEARANV